MWWLESGGRDDKEGRGLRSGDATAEVVGSRWLALQRTVMDTHLPFGKITLAEAWRMGPWGGPVGGQKAECVVDCSHPMRNDKHLE